MEADVAGGLGAYGLSRCNVLAEILADLLQYGLCGQLSPERELERYMQRERDDHDRHGHRGR